MFALFWGYYIMENGKSRKHTYTAVGALLGLVAALAADFTQISLTGSYVFDLVGLCGLGALAGFWVGRNK